MKTLRDLSNKALLKFIIIALLALGLTGMVPTESKAASGSISGIVTDESGNPVPDVFVYAYDLEWNPIRYAHSVNADGTYTLSSLDTGQYYVQVYSYIPGSWGDPGDYMIQYYDDKAGWNNAVPVSVTDGADTPGIDFALILGGSVSGTVLDEAGYPLPYDGYELMVDVIDNRWEYIRFGLVNPDGTYRVGGIKTGSYHVKTDSTYFEWDYDSSLIVDEYYNDTYDHNMANPVQVRLGEDTPGINFNLATTDGTITGSVLDTTGNPIADASVTAEESTTGYQKSNSSLTDGYYSIIALPPGNYVVTASDYPGRHTTEEYPTEVAVDDGVIASGIDFTLAHGGLISGTVTNTASSSPPLSYVYVFDSSWNLADSVTANNGSYTTTAPLQAGNYYVKAEPHPDHNPHDNIAAYYAGTPVQAEATLVTVAAGADTTGIDIAFSNREGTVSGTVTDSLGNPLANARVYFYTSDWLVEALADTDSSGNYSVGTVRSGTYYAWVRPYGNRSYMSQYYDHVNYLWYDNWEDASTFTVTAGVETTGIDFTLEEYGTVSGTVTDDAGNPLQGVSVRIYDPNWALITGAYTDASGNYTVDAQESEGPHYVRAYSPPYVALYYNNAYDYASAETVTITPGADTPGIDFTLTSSGTISGIVTDSLGNPLSGGIVRLYDSNWFYQYSAGTDANGNYQLPAVSAGPSYLSASKNSYVLEYYNNAYDQASATAVNITPGVDMPGMDFVLDLHGTVSGTVTNSLGGLLPGATVTLYDANWRYRGSATTDSSGNYTVSSYLDLGGAHYIKVTHSSYVTEYYDNAYDQASATTVTVTPGADTPGIDIALQIRPAVSGTVTDSLGNPISGATVSLYDSNWNPYGSGTTLPDGSYIFTNTYLDLGSYYVYAVKDGYLGEYYDDAPDQASATAVTLSAGIDMTGIDFALTGGGSISGVVTDTLGGPLYATTVTLYDSNWNSKGSFNTDSSGNYSFSSLLPGSYYLHAAKSSYLDEYYDDAPDQASATPVTAGVDTTGIDFALTRLGTVSGTVTDESGAPLYRITMNIYDSNWHLESSVTPGPDGSYQLYALTEGPYYVEAKSRYGIISEYYNNAYYRESATTVTVTYGADTPGIDFTLETYGKVSGTITDQTGTPASARVHLYRFYTTTSTWTNIGYMGTDGNGAYTFNYLAPGTYRVGAKKNSNGETVEYWIFYPAADDVDTASDVVVTSGSTTYGIDMSTPAGIQGGTITGFITDASGREHPTDPYCSNVAAIQRDPVTGALEEKGYYYGGGGDGVGPYRITGLEPGDYILLSFPDYCRWAYWIYDMTGMGTNSFEDAKLISVGEGETVNIDIPLPLRSSVSGTITDAGGNPISGVRIRLENMQHHYVDYEYLQDDIRVWDMLENTTDSDGNFRLTMLPGGNYFVYVYDENGVYETTYYSTNPSGSSTMVDLHPGEVTTGIDIQVEVVVP